MCVTRACDIHETTSKCNNLAMPPPSRNIPPPSAKIPQSSPELAQDCIEPESLQSSAIDVFLPHDLNDNPVSAHVPCVVDKCEGLVIGAYDDKVKILELINRGSFGRVYSGVRLKTGEKVAVKAEDQGSGHEKLMCEGNLCRKLEGCPGIPSVYWYGMHGSDYNFMVMDFLGPNLLDLFDMCNNRFSLQTVLKIGAELFPTLQYLHEQNIMHRDMSPRNIVIGVGQNHTKLYIIDFGLAKRCTRRGQMLLPSPTRYGAYCNPLVGTPRFASLNSHRGGIVGRTDDLESLGYVLVYLLKGSLPWQHEKADDGLEGIRYVEHQKVVTTVETLCEGIPDEFATLISYARLLKYYEMPDYKSIEILFKHLITAEDIKIDACFDWDRKDSDEQEVSKPRLKRTKSSLKQISSGSDETMMMPFSCSMCDTNTHLTCSSN